MLLRNHRKGCGRFGALVWERASPLTSGDGIAKRSVNWLAQRGGIVESVPPESSTNRGECLARCRFVPRLPLSEPITYRSYVGQRSAGRTMPKPQRETRMQVARRLRDAILPKMRRAG